MKTIKASLGDASRHLGLTDAPVFQAKTKGQDFCLIFEPRCEAFDEIARTLEEEYGQDSKGYATDKFQPRFKAPLTGFSGRGDVKVGIPLYVYYQDESGRFTFNDRHHVGGVFFTKSLLPKVDELLIQKKEALQAQGTILEIGLNEDELVSANSNHLYFD